MHAPGSFNRQPWQRSLSTALLQVVMSIESGAISPADAAYLVQDALDSFKAKFPLDTRKPLSDASTFAASEVDRVRRRLSEGISQHLDQTDDLEF